MYDFLSLPLLVRPNSVIPIGNQADKPNYDYSDGITLQIYQLDDGKDVQVEIPSLDGKIGTIFDVKRDGKSIRITRQGSAKPWNASVIGIETVDGKTLIQAGEQDNEISFHLA